jgi:hypothetical protein
MSVAVRRWMLIVLVVISFPTYATLIDQNNPIVTSPDNAFCYNSRVVIDACIPYERMDTFPRVGPDFS